VAVLGNRGTGLLDMLIEGFRNQGQEVITPFNMSPVDRERTPLQQAMNRPEVMLSQPGGRSMVTFDRGRTFDASPVPQVQAAVQSAAQPMSAQQLATAMPRITPMQVTPAQVESNVPVNRLIGGQQTEMGQGVMQPGMDREKMIRDAKVAKDVLETGDESLIERAKGYFGNRENMVRLALAFNSMRLTPDQGLAAALSAEQKDLRAQRTTTANATRTAQVLKVSHPKLAALLEQGVIDAKTAIQLTYKNPTELNQMIELMQSDPEMFQKLAQSGAFGGDIDLGQGTMFDEMAKTNIKNRDALIQGGTLAADLMRQLTRFQMQAEGLETGPLENRLQALREFGASIGVPVDDIKLQQGQSLKAASMNLVANELRKNKGPQTNFDAEYTEGFVPSLGNTAAANEEIINYMQSANRIMTIYGEMAVDMPYQTKDADKFLTGLQRDQMKTPAVSKFNGEWITFNEYYVEAKRLSRETGQPLTDVEILQQWRKDHDEKGEL